MYDIPILMLHSVNDCPKDNPMGTLAVSSKGLEAYLKVLSQWKYQMISMDDLLTGNYDKNRNYIVLTFDDGFKDNLTVAMPLLQKYNARATIFVNPAYVSPQTDPESDWGFMTWEEVEQAESSGVFDIQAHTMTHEFIFTSDEVVDHYTPDKFEKYYWLAWMLYPDAPNHWDSTANKYRDMIPTGYPVFAYGRRVACKKFTPDSAYVEHLIAQYQGQQSEFTGSHGTFETDEDYEAYIRWEIEECKKQLEEKLHKKIHTLCFPGGGYTDFALEVAKNCGIKCYMTASRMRIGNNNDHMAALGKGEFVGLNRTSFSRIYPGVLPDAFYDYWVAKLSLGTHQNIAPYGLIKKIMAKIFPA